jgi:LacI family transcriptional regulator
MGFQKNGITISQIAKELGISKTTVSRVLNDKADVSQSTREAVSNLIKKYHYTPNIYAQTIATGKSNTVALVIPYSESYVLENPYYSELIRGVSNELIKHAYYLMLIYSAQADYLSAIRQKRTDGVIIVSPGLSHKEIIKEILSLGTPLVSTSRTPGLTGVYSVVTKDGKGAEDAVNHLISLGHRKIAFINGPSILSSSSERFKGYKRALESSGISYRQSLVYESEPSIAGGYECAKKLFAQKGFTAIFAASDLIAIGVENAAGEFDIKIPKDISLVGFDNMPFAEYTNPPLTTIRQYPFKKGLMAARMLVNLLEGLPQEKRVEMPVDLIVRKSTRKI